jgi:hypothetical protein
MFASNTSLKSWNLTSFIVHLSANWCLHPQNSTFLWVDLIKFTAQPKPKGHHKVTSVHLHYYSCVNCVVCCRWDLKHVPSHGKFTWGSFLSSLWIADISLLLGDDGGGDDDDEEKLPSCGDYIMHFVTLFWKLLFAFVPPTGEIVCWATCLYIAHYWPESDVPGMGTHNFVTFINFKY